MTVNDILLWVAAGGAVLACLLGLAACLRPSAGPARLDALLEGLERTERARADIAEGQRGLRGELAESARALRAELGQARTSCAPAWGATPRPPAPSPPNRWPGSPLVSASSCRLIQINERRLSEVRATVDQRLQLLQADNGARLDEMRRTVDEKLHATLEQRLGESFKLVSERLEAVRAWAKCRRWPRAWAISSAC